MFLFPYIELVQKRVCWAAITNRKGQSYHNVLINFITNIRLCPLYHLKQKFLSYKPWFKNLICTAKQLNTQKWTFAWDLVVSQSVQNMPRPTFSELESNSSLETCSQ